MSHGSQWNKGIVPMSKCVYHDPYSCQYFVGIGGRNVIFKDGSVGRFEVMYGDYLPISRHSTLEEAFKRAGFKFKEIK